MNILDNDITYYAQYFKKTNNRRRCIINTMYNIINMCITYNIVLLLHYVFKFIYYCEKENLPPSIMSIILF